MKLSMFVVTLLAVPALAAEPSSGVLDALSPNAFAFGVPQAMARTQTNASLLSMETQVGLFTGFAATTLAPQGASRGVSGSACLGLGVHFEVLSSLTLEALVLATPGWVETDAQLGLGAGVGLSWQPTKTVSLKLRAPVVGGMVWGGTEGSLMAAFSRSALGSSPLLRFEVAL
jgi:hypothetical protein